VVDPAEEMALRWGIVSAGKISHDFVGALKSLSHEDHKVVAVAARSLSNAEDFAKNHNIPKAYEGYLKIAEDDDVGR
jgi:dihydrodiol dehydrogenase / D-xylose 1-dehydrogenase (NADP)